ncbi:hypothetical protein [Mycobacterium haemophilum]|uniref:hypothetical protein n=1 Tax=Mycobacterium haemophilum TaxID=29311 RepID=UPI000AB0CE98|nr:hypothetical protein [Mycobacterium haemophilum]
MTLLFSEWAGLSMAQYVRKMHKSSLYVSTIDLAVRKCYHILIIGPLIADEQW